VQKEEQIRYPFKALAIHSARRRDRTKKRQRLMPLPFLSSSISHLIIMSMPAVMTSTTTVPMPVSAPA
jgi:hypothetical protein